MIFKEQGINVYSETIRTMNMFSFIILQFQRGNVPKYLHFVKPAGLWVHGADIHHTSGSDDNVSGTDEPNAYDMSTGTNLSRHGSDEMDVTFLHEEQFLVSASPSVESLSDQENWPELEGTIIYFNFFPFLFHSYLLSLILSFLCSFLCFSLPPRPHFFYMFSSLISLRVMLQIPKFPTLLIFHHIQSIKQQC